uniref:Uncharacterized protein n=1 Tax=Triticum urartu TaxID=4572 RepID=A0A8R7TKZ3_TRIUA
MAILLEHTWQFSLYFATSKNYYIFCHDNFTLKYLANLQFKYMANFTLFLPCQNFILFCHGIFLTSLPWQIYF